MTKNMGDTLLNVNFTGGEPFARKDIIDIAKQNDIKISLNGNKK